MGELICVGVMVWGLVRIGGVTGFWAAVDKSWEDVEFIPIVEVLLSDLMLELVTAVGKEVDTFGKKEFVTAIKGNSTDDETWDDSCDSGQMEKRLLVSKLPWAKGNSSSLNLTLGVTKILPSDLKHLYPLWTRL